MTAGTYNWGVTTWSCISLCVRVVGSPVGYPKGMNKASKGQTNRVLESRQLSNHDGGGARPPYELYETGINEIGRGWIAPIFAFLKNRGGSEVVTIAAVLALFGIAREFIRNKDDGLDTTSREVVPKRFKE